MKSLMSERAPPTLELPRERLRRFRGATAEDEEDGSVIPGRFEAMDVGGYS